MEYWGRIREAELDGKTCDVGVRSIELKLGLEPSK